MIAKVAKLDRARHIVFEEETLPPVGDHDMLIRMEAVGLCHSELPAYLGVGGTGVSKHGYRCSVPNVAYPVGLGHEAVAEVVETGKYVTRFRVGDKIAGRYRGCLRTYGVIQNADVPVSTAMFFQIPPSDKDYRGCLSEPLECTVNIVKAASCKFGQRVAVVGCGFMGLLAIAGLKSGAAKQLTAVDIAPDKLKLALAYGATDTMDAGTRDLEELAYQMTDGAFYDVVVELSGSLRGFDTAMQLIKPAHRNAIHTQPYQGHGKVILPSVYSREEIFPSRLGTNLMLKTPILHAVHPMYDVDPCANHKEGIAAYADGRLPVDRMITHHIPFDELQTGYEWLIKAPAGYIKGVVDF
ncbi:zinc-binding dehydrogenase [Agathobaculum sp. NTUH-O15-33]|uniref:zinc-dependent alcohol dehydrogenase n=1 Tax=Agathobaculum sp. NTUH-O15-33 TaxID=3079302 RepID=UPI002958D756|nr:zinc-binding dehydrogenase [Agathobaculum sp. NTUH-O15-33]WNX85716.1 zinc-binding dehydrogenase [Agathobaculum sp. NTUH-O15-33]